MAGAKFGVDNLTAIVDYNGVQLDGTTDQVMPIGDLAAKFRAFGWECIECDGHDVEQLIAAYEAAKAVAGKPAVILAKTVKGKGVSFMEGKNQWHGSPVDDAHFRIAMEELGGAV